MLQTLARQADTRNDAPKARPSTERPIDLVHLASQTLGDRELEREILALMARQVEQCAARLELASEAERGALAHALKGSARNVGAFALADAAQAVEDHPAAAAALAAMREEIGRARDFIGSLLR
ncbi:hypothetical protein GCM10011390_07560 [Aureimonas endophytica]|uniref:HPt domain-containing protein n=1 Tax=Aureimonas endophytica TaxID=2027858 RepID=A0A916ZDU4_9HYPH|nr:Hpt domain-containing protein [Aureimonas endophytica]GGD91287.1 hypothetical protein GCM10011390_07560 [Aureimonas endophytica]